MTCATPSVTLRYTLNGVEPTTSDPTVTSGGTVALTATKTLKVKGWRSGWEESATASSDFSFQVATPAFSAPVDASSSLAETT